MESNAGESPKEMLDALGEGESPYLVVAPMERWYHLLLGLVVALLVLGQGLPNPWAMPVLISAIVGLIALMMWWSRSRGWWISGYASPRARWAAILGSLIAGVCALGSFAADSLVLSVSLAFIAGLACAVLSALWMRIWRKEIAAAHA